MNWKTYMIGSYVDFTLTSVGDGLWGMEPGVQINFTSAEIDLTVYDDDNDDRLWGYLTLKHNRDANKYGLVYTDSVEKQLVDVLNELEPFTGLIDSISGSEQGMQGRNTLSCDISLKPGITGEQLIAAGWEGYEGSWGEEIT